MTGKMRSSVPDPALYGRNHGTTKVREACSSGRSVGHRGDRRRVVGAVALGSVEAGAAPRVACAPAGSTGFTAALVVTTSGTTVSSNVDGTGCNLGIYVAPGANNVTISGITVSGAGDHGIMAENVSRASRSRTTPSRAMA